VTDLCFQEKAYSISSEKKVQNISIINKEIRLGGAATVAENQAPWEVTPVFIAKRNDLICLAHEKIYRDL